MQRLIVSFEYTRKLLMNLAESAKVESAFRAVL